MLKIPYSHCGKLLCLGPFDQVLSSVIFSIVLDTIRLVYNYLHIVKKVIHSPVSSRDVTDQALSGGNN